MKRGQLEEKRTLEREEEERRREGRMDVQRTSSRAVLRKRERQEQQARERERRQEWRQHQREWKERRERLLVLEEQQERVRRAQRGCPGECEEKRVTKDVSLTGRISSD